MASPADPADAEPALGRAAQPDVDLALDVDPLFCRVQHADQVVEGGTVRGSELEPRDEVEGLAEFAAMVQAASDPWQVRKRARDMVRALFENGAPLVMWQRPPFRALSDGDHCG